MTDLVGRRGGGGARGRGHGGRGGGRFFRGGWGGWGWPWRRWPSYGWPWYGYGWWPSLWPWYGEAWSPYGGAISYGSPSSPVYEYEEVEEISGAAPRRRAHLENATMGELLPLARRRAVDSVLQVAAQHPSAQVFSHADLLYDPFISAGYDYDYRNEHPDDVWAWMLSETYAHDTVEAAWRYYDRIPSHRGQKPGYFAVFDRRMRGWPRPLTETTDDAFLAWATYRPVGYPLAEAKSSGATVGATGDGLDEFHRLRDLVEAYDRLWLRELPPTTPPRQRAWVDQTWRPWSWHWHEAEAAGGFFELDFSISEATLRELATGLTALRAAAAAVGLPVPDVGSSRLGFVRGGPP